MKKDAVVLSFVLACAVVVLLAAAQVGFAANNEAGDDEDINLLREVIRITEAVDLSTSRLSFSAREYKRDLTPRASEAVSADIELADQPRAPLWEEKELHIEAWQDGYAKRRLDRTTIYGKHEGMDETKKGPSFETVTFTGEKSLMWFPERKHAVIGARDTVYALHGPFSYRLIHVPTALATVCQVVKGIAEGNITGSLTKDPEDTNLLVLQVGDPESGFYTKAILDKRHGYQVVNLEEYDEKYHHGSFWYSYQVDYTEVDGVPFPKSGTAKWFSPSGEETSVHTVEFSNVKFDPPDLEPSLFWPDLPTGTTVQDNIVDTSYAIGPPDVEQSENLKELLLPHAVEKEAKVGAVRSEEIGDVETPAGDVAPPAESPARAQPSGFPGLIWLPIGIGALAFVALALLLLKRAGKG